MAIPENLQCMYSALRSQEAVSAYLKSKQILHLGFARQYSSHDAVTFAHDLCTTCTSLSIGFDNDHYIKYIVHNVV